MARCSMGHLFVTSTYACPLGCMCLLVDYATKIMNDLRDLNFPSICLCLRKLHCIHSLVCSFRLGIQIWDPWTQFSVGLAYNWNVQRDVDPYRFFTDLLMNACWNSFLSVRIFSETKTPVVPYWTGMSIFVCFEWFILVWDHLMASVNSQQLLLH